MGAFWLKLKYLAGAKKPQLDTPSLNNQNIMAPIRATVILPATWVHSEWDGYEYHRSEDSKESIKLEPTGMWAYYSYGETGTRHTKAAAYQAILELREKRNLKIREVCQKLLGNGEPADKDKNLTEGVISMALDRAEKESKAPKKDVIKLPLFKESDFPLSTSFPPKLKAAVCNQFVRFVAKKFSYEEFPDWFYMKIRVLFNLGYHFDRGTFYSNYFSNLKSRYLFIQKLMNHSIIGSENSWTMADAEKRIQKWLLENPIDDALLVELDKELAIAQEKQAAQEPQEQVQTVADKEIQQQMIGGS